MSKSNEITINDVKYIRKDSITKEVINFTGDGDGYD